MQLVIIAGGKGTRLGLTGIPKPMVQLAGKPLLEHQVELAKRYGITDIYILSGHLAHVITDYFADGSRWGVRIHHIVEPYPLGTAGSVKLLEGKIKDRFLVFYGDVVMDFDVSEFIRFDAARNGTGTVIVHPNDHPYDSDLLQLGANSQVTHVLPKPHNGIFPNLVNAAVYIFSPEIFRFIEDGKSQDFGKHIFPKLVQSGQPLYAYRTAEYIKDMGTAERFEKVTQDFVSGKVARLNKKNPRPCVFLDRDGVINPDMGTHPSAAGFTLLPGVEEAIKQLNASDYLSVVVTNQPMIAKGFVSQEEVEKTHCKLETLLGQAGAFVNGIYYCPHHPEKGFAGERAELKISCACRKPKPGMLLQAAKDMNIDLARSWMVGDSQWDMQAGQAAGCKTLFITNGTTPPPAGVTATAPDLATAVKIILEDTL